MISVLLLEVESSGTQNKKSLPFNIDHVLLQTNEQLSSKHKTNEKTAQEPVFKNSKNLVHHYASNERVVPNKLKDVRAPTPFELPRSSKKKPLERPLIFKNDALVHDNLTPTGGDKHNLLSISKFSRQQKNFDTLVIRHAKESKDEQNINAYLKEVQRKASERNTKGTSAKPNANPEADYRSLVRTPFQFTAQKLSEEVLKKIKDANLAHIGASDNLSLIIVFLHRGLRRV